MASKKRRPAPTDGPIDFNKFNEAIAHARKKRSHATACPWTGEPSAMMDVWFEGMKVARVCRLHPDHVEYVSNIVDGGNKKKQKMKRKTKEP